MESKDNNRNGAAASCPDAVRLWKYAHGKLSTAEQFEVEHHALSCRLCHAAIEGYASVTSLPELGTARERLFSGRSKWWSIAGVIVAVAGVLWSGGLFRSAQQNLPEPDPSPRENPVAPVVSAPADTTDLLASDTLSNVNIRKASPEEVRGERRRRWGDELFMVEKRGVETVPVGSVKAGVKGRSRLAVVYIEGLKVAAYKERLNNEGPALEVNRNLHPRFANENDKGREAFYTDTDTILYRELLTDALRAFNFGLCVQVLDQLKVIGEKYPDDQNVWFYSGMCAKNSGHLSEAIAFFGKMVSDESSPFHEEAMWHSALCYEESGDLASAMKLYRRIAEDEGFYSEAAARKL